MRHIILHFACLVLLVLDVETTKAFAQPKRLKSVRNHVESPPVLLPSNVFEAQQTRIQEQRQLCQATITRGGGLGDDLDSSKERKRVVAGVKICAAVMLAWFSWVYRANLAAVFNKEKLQATTIKILSDLDKFPKIYSYSIYTLGMAFWEALGLSTIPIETAAAMVFGWKGFILSGTAKLLGATFAFCIGRYGFLANWVKRQLSSNEFLNLVEESTGSNPIRTVTLMKMSCFPENVKNFGSAILKPIRLWMFVVATMIHGWSFTALWTFLGVDASRRLIDPSLPANTFLQKLLVLSVINGVVVSPLSMALWARDLKKTNKLHDNDRGK